MGRRRYNWVIRTLESWADHWIRAARVHEIQMASRLYDRIREGKLKKSTKPHMKVPSSKAITTSHAPNFPIMDDWLTRVQAAIDEFLTDQEHKVLFYRYFGHEYGMYRYEDCALKLGMTREAYKQRLKKIHRILGKELDYVKYLR